MLAPTPDRVQVTDRASVDAGVLSFDGADESYFYAQLGNPAGGSRPASPRERGEVWLRYPIDAVIEAPPHPGSEIEVNGAVFEVSEAASILSQGTRRIGYEMKVVAHSDAYPTPCSILDPTGDVIAETDIAMWTPKERHDDRGERVDQEGEAPGALFDSLVPRNTTITVGDGVWRVTECVLDLDLGRTLLKFRNTRGDD